jgi:hypothetical protein
MLENETLEIALAIAPHAGVIAWAVAVVYVILILSITLAFCSLMSEIWTWARLYRESITKIKLAEIEATKKK